MTAVMAFSAHNDDVFAWMLPDLQHAVTAGASNRTVYVTAGANSGDTTTENERVLGTLAGHANIAGVANAWTLTDAGISGHAAWLYTLNANTSISVVFMRIVQGIPTGGSPIQNLIAGGQATVANVPGTVTYTLAQLKTALQYLVGVFTPDTVYIQDFAGNPGDGDHSDHHTISWLARDAVIAWQATTPTTPVTITAYEGYDCQYLATDVSGPDQTAKTATIAAYATASSNVSNPPGYDIQHQYVTSQLILPAAGPWLVQQATVQHNGQAGVLAGTGTATGSPAYATGASNEYLVSFYADAGGPTATTPAGWTADAHTLLTDANGNVGVAYKNSTGGAETGSWGSSSGAVPWCVITTAFKLSGSWAVRQSASAANGFTATFGSTCISGSVLLAFVRFDAYIGAYSSGVQDAAANKFTKIAEVQSGAGVMSSVWAMATPAGDAGVAAAITAASSGGGAYGCGILIQEVTGITAVPDAASHTVTISLPAASAAGNTLVLCGRTVATASAAAAVLPSAVTDSGGNTWAVPASPASNPPAVAFPAYSAAFAGWALRTGAGATTVTVTLANAAYAELAVTEWSGIGAVSAAGTIDNHVAAAEIVGPSLALPAAGAAVVGLAYPAAGVATYGHGTWTNAQGTADLGGASPQPVPYALGTGAAAPVTGASIPLGGVWFDSNSESDAVNWAAWQVTSAAGTLAWDWGVAAASIQAAVVFAAGSGGPAPAPLPAQQYPPGWFPGAGAAAANPGGIPFYVQPPPYTAAVGVTTAIAYATSQDIAGAGSGSWVNPGNADGSPDGSFATWTAP